MGNKNEKRYVVRNTLHQTLGDFSEDEVISQIRKGRLLGDEEYFVSLEDQWKKIVSVPRFYDELVRSKLLFRDDLNTEQPKETVSPESQVNNQLVADEKAGATEHRDLNPTEKNGSIFQDNNPHEQTEFLAEQKAPSDSSYDSLFSLKAAPETEIELAPETSTEPLPPAQSSGFDRKHIKQRKVIGLTLAVVLVGVLLIFNQAEQSPKQDSSANPVPTKGFFLETSEADLRNFYEKSAQQAYQMDLPAGYREAANFYLKLVEKEKNPESQKEFLVWQAMSLARLIESQPANENLLREFQTTLERGRKLAPQDTGFFRAEAIALHAKADYDKAKQKQALALQTDSLNPANLLVEAEWMVDLEQYQDAKKLLESVLSWSQHSIRATYLYALSQEKLNQLDEAWEAAQKVIQLNPTHAPAYILLADILSKKNDLNGAKALYLLAGKFAHVSPGRAAGRAFWRAGSLSELRSSLSEETEQLYQLSYYYSDEFKERVLKKIQEAPTDKEIETAQKKYLADPSYFERLGLESMERKSYERSEGFYLVGSWAYPMRPAFLLGLADAREALARTQEEFRWAVVSYEKAIAAAPENSAGYIKLGLLETEQANFNRAFEILQRVESLDPENAVVQLALGKHFFSRKDFREAIERFRMARRSNPNLSEISFFQGKLYQLFDPQNTQTAMRHFEEAYSKDPQNYEAMAEWLKLKVVSFDKIFAVKFLRNMLAQDPKNPKLFWVLGEVYSEAQEFNKAAQYYKKALDINPEDSAVRLSLGRALAKLGKLDEAIAEYTLSSNLNAKNGEGYFLAADILYQGKRYQEAQNLLLGLLKMIPNYPGARRLLALCYQWSNKPDLAVEQMTLEAQANPMNYQYGLELADLLLENKRYQAAVDQLGPIINLPIEKNVEDSRSPSGFRKEATGLLPYRLRGLLLLSRTLREMGRYDAAEGAIQSAMRLDPKNLEVQQERGFVYHFLGRHQEAAEDFRSVLDKNPNISGAVQMKKIIRDTIIED